LPRNESTYLLKVDDNK